MYTTRGTVIGACVAVGVGLGLAYGFAHIGDAIAMWGHREDNKVGITLARLTTLFIILFGGSFLFSSMNEGVVSDRGTAFFLQALGIGFLGFVFGNLIVPFENYGANPLNWWHVEDTGNWLFLFAFVPTFITARRYSAGRRLFNREEDN